MGTRPALVVTSIASATPSLQALAAGAANHGYRFILIGDEPSPAGFHIDGCDFYSLDEQRNIDLRFARACPVRHYARKNIGYLIAMSFGVPYLVESDDDSSVYDEFWATRSERHSVPMLTDPGWANVYRYFGGEGTWPRGLPLDAINNPVTARATIKRSDLLCPIQQGLVDDDPDVDAIYRLLFPLPYRFESDEDIALARGTWSPFNSQNTTWWPRAFPLLYLPANCSFRMTDIWRSFVAQRIAWENGWAVLFHSATLRQERNVHDLMIDFRDEVPGYLHNRAIAERLNDLKLQPGEAYIAENMRTAYECLIDHGWLPPAELQLLDAWLADVDAISEGRWADAAPVSPAVPGTPQTG